jgi:hypothetical protein
MEKLVERLVIANGVAAFSAKDCEEFAYVIETGEAGTRSLVVTSLAAHCEDSSQNRKLVGKSSLVKLLHRRDDKDVLDLVLVLLKEAENRTLLLEDHHDTLELMSSSEFVPLERDRNEFLPMVMILTTLARLGPDAVANRISCRHSRALGRIVLGADDEYAALCANHGMQAIAIQDNRPLKQAVMSTVLARLFAACEAAEHSGGPYRLLDQYAAGISTLFAHWKQAVRHISKEQVDRLVGIFVQQRNVSDAAIVCIGKAVVALASHVRIVDDRMRSVASFLTLVNLTSRWRRGPRGPASAEVLVALYGTPSQMKGYFEDNTARRHFMDLFYHCTGECVKILSGVILSCYGVMSLVAKRNFVEAEGIRAIIRLKILDMPEDDANVRILDLLFATFRAIRPDLGIARHVREALDYVTQYSEFDDNIELPAVKEFICVLGTYSDSLKDVLPRLLASRAQRVAGEAREAKRAVDDDELDDEGDEGDEDNKSRPEERPVMAQQTVADKNADQEDEDEDEDDDEDDDDPNDDPNDADYEDGQDDAGADDDGDSGDEEEEEDPEDDIVDSAESCSRKKRRTEPSDDVDEDEEDDIKEEEDEE